MGASPMLHGRGARATFMRVPMSSIPIHLTTPSEERARHVSSLRSTWDIPLITLAFLPGLALLPLCWLQGHFEHARGVTSHYGRLYNLLFFNDGYHVEHHHRPAVHWHNLPQQTMLDPRPSHWPAVLRWIEEILSVLERLVFI